MHCLNNCDWYDKNLKIQYLSKSPESHTLQAFNAARSYDADYKFTCRYTIKGE